MPCRRPVLYSGQVNHLLQRARDFERVGDDESAKLAYLEYLRTEPDDVEALIDLGNLAFRTGFRSAACSAYRRATELDAYNPLPYVNLGNALLQQGGLDEARRAYESAISVAPAFAPAHQGLSYVYVRLGDERSSRVHRDLGFSADPVQHIPYRGTGTPVRALVFVSAAGGDFNTERLLDSRTYGVTKIFAEYARPADAAIPHDVAVNAIGDADRCAEALEAAARLSAQLTLPLINAPDRVLKTGRLQVSGIVASVRGAIAPRAALLRREDLRDLSFPILLRTPGHHTGRHFVKVDSAAGLPAALASLPGEELLALQYVDVRNPDGFVRKYRMMAIGGRLFPVHAAVSRDWKVHFFTSEASSSDSHRDEDARFLADPDSVLRPQARAALQAIADALALDYAGVDFGLDREGRPVVFEANATMSLYPASSDPRWHYRREAEDRIVAAFRELGRQARQL